MPTQIHKLRRDKVFGEGRCIPLDRNAKARGDDPPVPVNDDPVSPVNRWRANNRAFMAAWLQLAASRKRAAVPVSAALPQF